MHERIKEICAKVDPLAERITQLEQQQKDLEKKLETVRGIEDVDHKLRYTAAGNKKYHIT